MTLPTDHGLARDVLLHLSDQIAFTREMLQVTLAQGAAIRSQDVDGVVRRVQELRVVTAGRERLDRERVGLLERAALGLGTAPTEVTLELMTALFAPAEGSEARRLSGELKRLLAELAQVTHTNRALMRQELSFLDHLLKLAGHPSEPGYRPTGEQPLAGPTVVRETNRLLDMQA